MNHTVILIEKETHQRFVLNGYTPFAGGVEKPCWFRATDDADYGDQWFTEIEARNILLDAQGFEFIDMPKGYNAKLIKRTITYTLAPVKPAPTPTHVLSDFAPKEL